MVPPGYSGGGVWGSNFVVDKERRTVFVGTGNNYSHPTDPAYLACISAGGHRGDVQRRPTTTSMPSSRSPSHGSRQVGEEAGDLVAAWRDRRQRRLERRLLRPRPHQLPVDAGPDYDFASAPNLITYKGRLEHEDDSRCRPEERHLLRARPGHGCGAVAHAGGPGLVARRDGVGLGHRRQTHLRLDRELLWHSAPQPAPPDRGRRSTRRRARSSGRRPIRTAQSLWARSPSPTTWSSCRRWPARRRLPTMLALMRNGQHAVEFAAGSSVNAGASVVDDTVFWGSGYAHLGIPGYTGAGSPNVTTKFLRLHHEVDTAPDAEGRSVTATDLPRLTRPEARCSESRPHHLPCVRTRSSSPRSRSARGRDPDSDHDVHAQAALRLNRARDPL